MSMPIEKIINVDFSNAIKERYFSYAISSIMSRSLPDVRDGLKPVHRRLLYAMLKLRLDPKSMYKKCARIVGDVIGKYHPHGDQSVYDALVRLAQSFSLRYPIIDGQGNFGSIDGDNAAAMRYTESKLTHYATLIMHDIENNTVPFRPTYDGQDDEPEIMPSMVPNLLANGSEGIAVGMATSVPPHNLAELCDAMLAIIKNPNITVEELVENYIKGPDLPTGGKIIEPVENIISIYKTGRGSLRLRSTWEVEKLSHGNYNIVITEIPYQIKKSKLIAKIADLIMDKKLLLISDVRDESDENIRIVIEPRNRTIDADSIMESLFKSTELETRINVNMNVLSSNLLPKVMSITEVLSEFISHRKLIVTNRSKNRLEQIINRIEILDGYLIAYLNLDEVIRIIREEDDAKSELMKKFGLTENQVEAVLNMRLKSLRKLEEIEIKSEKNKLEEEKAVLEEILGNENSLMKVISKETRDIKKYYDYNTDLGQRKTEIIHKQIEAQVINIEAFIEKEPITIVLSKMGWIRALKGHNIDYTDIKYKEGDEERFIIKAQSTDKILVLSKFGKCYTISADKFPRGKGFGEPIRMMTDMQDAEDDIIDIMPYVAGQKILLASSIGKGFIIESDSLVAQTKNGKVIYDASKETRNYLYKICLVQDNDHVAIIGENRKMLIFPISEIPVMKKGQGVTLQKYREGGISDIKLLKLSDGFSYHSELTDLAVKVAKIDGWIGHRAGIGKMAPTGFAYNNKFN